MKQAILSILCCLCYIISIAQIPQTHKVVYLRDGTNVKGTVTVNDSAGYVMVVDYDKETHYYQKNMVAKIDDEVAHQRGYTLKNKGYLCTIELGGSDVLAKDNGSNLSSFSLNVVNSYLFSPFVSLGLGIGTELSSSGTNIEMFSLYADTRIYFIRSNVSPFFNLDFGYNGMFIKYSYYDNFNNDQYDVAKDGDHGLMFNPALGIRVAVSRSAAFTAAVGFKLYYLHTSQQYYNIMGDNTFRPSGNYYDLNAISIKAGVQF